MFSRSRVRHSTAEPLRPHNNKCLNLKLSVYALLLPQIYNTHACMHACTHACTHAHNAHTHTHTHTHTDQYVQIKHTPTDIHTCTHTHALTKCHDENWWKVIGAMFLILTDINECDIYPDICQNGRCVNTDGSFRCECFSGHKLDKSGRECIGKLLYFCLHF